MHLVQTGIVMMRHISHGASVFLVARQPLAIQIRIVKKVVMVYGSLEKPTITVVYVEGMVLVIQTGSLLLPRSLLPER